MNYKREELIKIGNNAASIWGGSCIDYEIDEKGEEVIFDCIEHGERFTTSLKFKELKEYDY